MAKRTTDNRHHLSGDWTIAGVMSQMDSLTHSLQKLESGHKKRIHIDCENIHGIDMCGLQLLHVWLQCARNRGVEAQLVNLPDTMHKTIQHLGLGHCFTDNYPDAA